MGAKFTGESYKCTPRQSKSPIFEEIEAWMVGVVNIPKVVLKVKKVK